MYLNYLLSFYLYIISCFMFCFYYKHLLLMIISLEFMMILMIYNMLIINLIIDSNVYLIILLLTFMVCEGALALSLIVLVVRFYGNDYINSLMILKW